MRQIWITRTGAPEVLAVKEAPDPQPKAGEVRVRVEASGINFADILGRMGLYPDLPPNPVVPGYEVSGRVDARRRPGRRGRLDRTRRHRHDALRRLCGHGSASP